MTKTTSKYRYTKKEGVRGGWYVHGVRLHVIGTVWKNSRHYNLARPFTVRGWSATKLNGATIGHEHSRGEARIFRTRDEAAEALEEVYE